MAKFECRLLFKRFDNNWEGLHGLRRTEKFWNICCSGFSREIFIYKKKENGDPDEI